VFFMFFFVFCREHFWKEKHLLISIRWFEKSWKVMKSRTPRSCLPSTLLQSWARHSEALEKWEKTWKMTSCWRLTCWWFGWISAGVPVADVLSVCKLPQLQARSIRVYPSKRGCADSSDCPVDISRLIGHKSTWSKVVLS
jgi:hypothetical protein